MSGISPRDVKRRIHSIKNTQKITRAMEMVSAAKMRRAQVSAQGGRPYALRGREVLLAALRQAEERDISLPLLMRPRAVKKIILVLITTDKGLAGGINTQVIHTFNQAVKEEQAAGHDVKVIAVGQKGINYLSRTTLPLLATFPLGDKVRILDVYPLARLLTDEYEQKKVDRVIFVYTEYVNTLKHLPRAAVLLPVTRETLPRGEGKLPAVTFEPTVETALEFLLPNFVRVQILHYLLESIASEHSARMVAMKNASESAADMVADLELDFNHLRQQNITRELSEIVSGANC